MLCSCNQTSQGDVSLNILCVGDVIGSAGCDFLRSHLPSLKRLKSIDVVIVNGENSADTNGITPASAYNILSSGADCITTGNHCFQRRESYEMYDDENFPVIRPANYPDSVPGRGVQIIDLGRTQVCVINLMGNVYMGESLDCPFATMDYLLDDISAKTILVDFHAEATAEKRALAHYLDGRVSAVFGTHTHVQTADEQILEGGTGFITDLGMTGPYNSVIGVRYEAAISKMTTHMPTRLDYAAPPCMLNAVLFDIDERTGKTRSVERINMR